MPWDVLIRGGQVVTPDGVRRLDVAVEGDSIVELSPELAGGAKAEIDAAGLHVFPGLIDAHVHFNEPGRTEWEGFDTGSAALAAGGGTCFFDMPLNAHPPTLDGPSFDLKLAAALKSSRTDFALWGGLTPDNLDGMEELADRGVVGFKAFMSSSGIDDFGRADDETLRRGMAIAAGRDLIVAVHAESEAITSRLAAEIRKQGRTSWRDYLASRPVEAEVEAVTRAARIARDVRCRLHVVHVSSAAGIAALNDSTDPGRQPIDGRPTLDRRAYTRETCPHYLLLDESALMKKGGVAKCAPPLRSAAEVEALRGDLLSGRVDIVGSDHSPAPGSMKTGDDAFKIWGGISGVQSTLSGLLTIGASPELVAKLTAGNVAERFNIVGKGRVQPGFDADLALVDVDAEYALTRDMLLDRHRLSPYVGRRFRGVVRRTMVRGRTVFLDGKTVSGDFRGRLVKPARTARNGGGADHA